MLYLSPHEHFCPPLAKNFLRASRAIPLFHIYIFMNRNIPNWFNWAYQEWYIRLNGGNLKKLVNNLEKLGYFLQRDPGKLVYLEPWSTANIVHIAQ